ncbi:hypothetical protein B0T17DRAFT_586607 [Bombardia bombarda]|uniref:Shugoshin n=1 Tax=Bombardia bombarda TaxID=252184 RepID=A0AA39XJ30_9PEZI|nr:hypothetical protein B0T17DRAFT_586607 [Bombardia bombarda]
MARLNEPPMTVTADSFDLLRRKFLRQNRDIARINSTQSLRIRGLENECARLLSENLDLRGQILRLEKDIEDNSARRIADHALEIKAKMEAQLEEWGTMLAGLGLEPPSKRRSTEGRRYARSRTSNSGRSPAQRKQRDVGIDAEALAAQEGRLPPIYENKSYPRATMNSEEILALCLEAADSSGNSPDLGPPPVSRFVEDDDLAKSYSPSKKARAEEPESPPTTEAETEVEADDYNGDHAPFETQLSPCKLDYDRKPLGDPELEDETEPAQTDHVKPQKDENPTIMQQQPTSAPIAVIKPGAKRKYGDENENTKSAKIIQPSGKENSMVVMDDSEKGFPAPSIQKRRSIKELSASRREKAASSRVATPASTITRMPLSAKSTNEDISSPGKMSKAAAPMMDEVKAAKVRVLKDSLAKERRREELQRPVVTRIDIPQSPSLAPPSPSSAAVTAVLHTKEPETTSILPPSPPPPPTRAAPTVSPDIPDQFSQQQQQQPRKDATSPHPSSDVDSNGEMTASRGAAGGRRSRPAISYAEPNLRDKMRRPSKQLFDAVAGEGKFKARSSMHQQQKLDNDCGATQQQQQPASAVRIKSEQTEGGSSAESWKSLPIAETAATTAATSPLAQKKQRSQRPDVVVPPLNNSSGGGVTERRKQPRPSTGVDDRPEEINTAAEPVSRTAKDVDVYDFASSTASLSDNNNNNLQTQPDGGKPTKAKQPAARSRRASAAVVSSSSSSTVVETVTMSSKSRSSQPRKRASMVAASKKTSSSSAVDADDGGDDGEDAFADTETTTTASGRDRISRRRRSMMI